MPVERLESRITLHAARSIAKSLTPAEDNLDASILAGANLVAAIAKGRLDTNSPPETGHAALMSAIAGVQSLAVAREQFVSCHRQLTVVRDAARIRAEDAGCHIGKFQEPSGMTTQVAAA